MEGSNYHPEERRAVFLRYLFSRSDFEESMNYKNFKFVLENFLEILY